MRSLLVIADLPATRSALTGLLNEEFFLIFAQTALKALEIAASTALEAAILDERFEDCEALDLSARIRELNPILPILLVTDRLKESFRQKAFEAGATGFLSSRFAAEELHEELANAFHAASIREKTMKAAGKIPHPRLSAASSLQTKFLLTREMIRLLAAGKLLLLLIQTGAAQQETIPFLRARLAAKDLLVPLSDGRFAVLLPQASLKEAEQIALGCRAAFPRSSCAIGSLEAAKELNALVDKASHALEETSHPYIILSDTEIP